jgi:hypothetical protein
MGIGMNNWLSKRAMVPGLLLVAAAATAQEHPDFTGAWTTYRGNLNAAGATGRVIGQVVLKPESQAAVDAYKSLIEGTNYSPGNACVGYGMPESMMGSGGYPMEIIQRPEQLLVVYELHNEIRRIYMQEAAQDPTEFFPERNGYSTAHWEGERLVVETTRLKTQVDTRYPHSNEARIREEYYFDEPLPDGTKVLAADVLMEDPQWLAEPYKATKRWQALADYHVRSYECSEPLWLDEMELLYEKSGLEMLQE